MMQHIIQAPKLPCKLKNVALLRAESTTQDCTSAVASFLLSSPSPASSNILAPQPYRCRNSWNTAELQLCILLGNDGALAGKQGTHTGFRIKHHCLIVVYSRCLAQVLAGSSQGTGRPEFHFGDSGARWCPHTSR